MVWTQSQGQGSQSLNGDLKGAGRGMVRRTVRAGASGGHQTLCRDVHAMQAREVQHTWVWAGHCRVTGQTPGRSFILLLWAVQLSMRHVRVLVPQAGMTAYLTHAAEAGVRAWQRTYSIDEQCVL